jgi:diguanylate cyclase (GGDEF)-like protein
LQLRGEELLKQGADLQAANRLLEDQASQDGLTGLVNRRRLDEYLQEMWVHCLEQRLPLSLLMIDADHFKQFNDAHGHLAGDEVLRVLADTLSTSVTDPAQLLARFAGEEFVAVLPGYDQARAHDLAEFMRQAVVDADSQMQQVTVSIGVGEIQPIQGDKVDLLLQRADEAMYQAKREGRNCVV